MNKFLLTLAFTVLIAFVANAQTQLTIRAYSEGFYRSGSDKMVAVIDPLNLPSACDSAYVEIIDSATYQTIHCANVLVSTDGYSTCMIPSSVSGKCFASIKFRNTYHILSNKTMNVNGTAQNIDMTDIPSACCNFDTLDGVAKAFSGDVNHDGVMDGGDFVLLDGDVQSHATGYLITDLTGDRVVDSLDYAIFDKNFSNSISDDYVGICQPSGIDELENQRLNIYPNPCSDFFRVDAEKFKNARLEIFDYAGRLVLCRNIFGNEYVHTSDLQKGIYIIRISNKASNKFGKVVID